MSQTPVGQGMARAFQHFQRANALDPGLAGAWSGMALSRLGVAFFGGAVTGNLVSLARQEALKAIELDSRDGDAYSVLGMIALYHDWNPEGARPLLEKAVRLNPHDSMLRHSYADYFLVTGRFETSLEEVRLGRDNDPRSPLAQTVVMFHAQSARRFDDVIAEARRTIPLFPPLARQAHWFIADALWRQGKYEEAMPEGRLSYAEDSEGWLAFEAAYRRGGPRAAMKARAQRMSARTQGVQNAVAIASAYADAGDVDTAMAWLEKAFTARVPQILHVPATPAFDSMSGDPRFRDLLRRVGIQLPIPQ